MTEHSDARGRMVLNFNIDPIGHHHAAWQHPDTDPGLGTDIAFYIDLARRAERASVDAVFIADGLTQRVRPGAGRTPGFVLGFEPVTLFSAIAARTERIGVILTISSTFTEPYTVARQLASLDQLSGGRSGINIVTSTSDAAAQNYGAETIPDHSERYRRAGEYVEVLCRLWDSWGEGSLTRDASGRVVIDHDRITEIDHRGEFYRVRGPLNIPRSPQGRPVIVQAGSSEDGRAFASRHADVLYTIAQTLDGAQDFFADIKRRAREHGRNPDRVKIVLGIRVLVDDSDERALARASELNDLLPLAEKLAGISRLLQVDLTGFGADDPIPELPEPGDGQQFQTQLTIVKRLVADGEIATIGDLARVLDGAQGVSSIAGSPETVADHLEHWWRERAADGFTILPQVTQIDGPRFLDEVVPILQARGLVRRGFEGTTLKEHLGLDD